MPRFDISATIRQFLGFPQVAAFLPAVALGAYWLAGERADAGPTPVVLDIRSEAEHAGGHIAGSLNIPLPSLEERIGEVPAGKPVVVHCAGGYRSAIGASVLQKLGREGVHDLVGGFQAWVATKEPTTAGS